MQEEAEAYLEGWGDEGEVDVLGALNKITVFIASHSLIGGEFRRRLSKEFAHLYHDLEGGITLPRLRRPVPAGARFPPARPRAGPGRPN